jgi:hypothetical protein
MNVTALSSPVSTPSVGKWQTVRPWLGTLVRLGLAAVWLVAGGTKVGDLAASGRAVNAYDVMPYDVAKVVGAALPVVFIAGIASAWARGLQIDCGCFGSGGQLAAGQSPTYGPEIARDLGFLVLAGFLLIYPLTRWSVDSWMERE